MSEVTLEIGGRSYTVACQEGQESHIEMLGGMIEEKLASMGQLAPSRSQNLLFAGLFLADDLHEEKGKAGSVDGLTRELEALRISQEKAVSEVQEIQLERDALLSEHDTMRDDHTSIKNELATAQAALEEANAELKKTTGRLSQANVQIAQLETQKAAAQKFPDPTPQLEELASTLEKCATKLEQRLPDA